MVQWREYRRRRRYRSWWQRARAGTAEEKLRADAGLAADAALLRGAACALRAEMEETKARREATRQAAEAERGCLQM
jgi:hypothetical protein